MTVTSSQRSVSILVSASPVRAAATQGTGERLFICAIALLSFALRVRSIDVPINLDEALWVQRGALFVGELLDVRPEGTYVRPHPGVTSMWLVGASLTAQCLTSDTPPPSTQSESPLRTCLAEKATTLFHPLPTYVAPRLAQALVTSLLLAYIYVLARRLLGAGAARLAAALLVFEPFFLAYQRFITTDALESDLATIALLLLLLYLRGDGGKRTLLASGAWMGLAIASKIPVVLLLPVVVLWIVAIEQRAWSVFPARGVGRQAADLLLWIAALAGTIVLIWPALWVAPLEVAGRLFADLRLEADERLQFFLGRTTYDPGPLFYPAVLAYRLSPLLQAGGLASLTALAIPALRRRLERTGELTALAFVPTALVVMLTLAGATKFDRYLLPALPALALVAAGGWSWILGRLETTRWKACGPLAVGVGQLVLLWSHFPYCLTYYNPLLGGTPAAETVLALGQGEGLDQAARWLNREPGVERMTVATWHAPAFAPYFRGRTAWIPYDEERVPGRWTGADRIVIYVSQRQVSLPHPVLLRHLAAQEPLYTVRLHGVDYARVYAGPAALPPEPDAAP